MSEPQSGSVPAGDRAPTTLARVREVAARAGFRRFFATRLVSQCGDGIFQLSAAAVLLFEHPGDNPAVAAFTVAAVTLVPFSIIGPFTGVFIDRWDRHKIITWVPVVRAAVAVLLPVAALGGNHGVAFYAVVLFVLSTNRFFLATMSALLPQLIPEDDLIVGNAASSTGGAVANVVGQGIGSVISAIFSGATAGLFAGGLFTGSAFVARGVPVLHGFEHHDRGPLGAQLRGVLREMRDGLREVARHARVVYALSAIIGVQVMVGAMTGVLTYYFIHVLHLKIGSVTAILAVLAVGIGAGVLFVPFATRRVRHDALIPVSFVIGAVANTIAGVVLSRSTLLAGATLAGISYAFAKIPVDTIVQEEMEDIVRGRAFAVYDMLFNVARVAGVGIVALAYERGTSSRAIVGAIAAGYLSLAVVFTLWERREPMFKRKRAQQRTVLREGEIVTVRAYAGARADEEPRAIVVGGHEMPIEQIDWRAVVEEGGRRARVFVVRAGGQRIRLARYEDAAGWEVQRLLPFPATAPES